MHHLAGHGSDGFVVCGTTGEAPTLTDEEHLRADRARGRRSGPHGTTIVAGVGSNDTRHAVAPDRRARASSAPTRCCRSTRTTTGPTGAGSSPTTARSRAPPTGRSCSTTSRQRTGSDMPNDLLAELAQIDHVERRQAGQQRQPRARRRARALRRQRRHPRARRSTWAARAASCVASHIVGAEMRRMVDEPDSARRDRRSACRTLYAALGVGPAAMTTKAALELLGHRAGAPRLPLVEADEAEIDAAARRARRPRPARDGRALMAGTLRVLPLGGLGEIGKNMTVLEYEERLAGRRRAACASRPPRWSGIDLVLPDFAYLRGRVDDIEGIVITHGHEDHLGALPWILRELAHDGELPPVFGAPLTMAMARSKLDEHRLKDVEVEDVAIGEHLELGPVRRRADPHDALDPRRRARSRSATELGTVLITGDYKFDQTPVDGPPADVARLAAARRRGPAAALRRLDERRPPGLLAQRARRRAAPRAGLPALRGPHRRDLLRVEHPPRPAGRRRRRARSGARSRSLGRSMRKNIEHRPLARPHRGAGGDPDPAARDRRLPRREARDHLHRVPGRAAQRAAPDGLQRPPAGRAARGRHGRLRARRRSPATSAPSTRRSTASTTSAASVITTRDAPIHASGHGYAEEIKLMLNLVRPRYVMPFHGDFKRIRPARAAGRVGRRRRPRTSSRARTACRSRSTSAARASASPSAPGMIFVDGVEIGDVADVALRDRRMLSADGIFVVVATISEQDGSSVAEPEVIFRGVPFPDEAESLLDEIRATRRGLADARGQGGDPRDRPPPEDAARRPRGARLRPPAPPADGAAGRRRGLSRPVTSSRGPGSPCGPSPIPPVSAAGPTRPVTTIRRPQSRLCVVVAGLVAAGRRSARRGAACARA